MRLHARTAVVEKAKRQFQREMDLLEDDYDLTDGEITSILGSYLMNRAKYMIRSERHPDDPNKRGDEE